MLLEPEQEPVLALVLIDLHARVREVAVAGKERHLGAAAAAVGAAVEASVEQVEAAAATAVPTTCHQSWDSRSTSAHWDLGLLSTQEEVAGHDHSLLSRVLEVVAVESVEQEPERQCAAAVGDAADHNPTRRR